MLDDREQKKLAHAVVLELQIHVHADTIRIVGNEYGTVTAVLEDPTALKPAIIPGKKTTFKVRTPLPRAIVIIVAKLPPKHRRWHQAYQFKNGSVRLLPHSHYRFTDVVRANSMHIVTPFWFRHAGGLHIVGGLRNITF